MTRPPKVRPLKIQTNAVLLSALAAAGAAVPWIPDVVHDLCSSVFLLIILPDLKNVLHRNHNRRQNHKEYIKPLPQTLFRYYRIAEAGLIRHNEQHKE